MESVGLEVTIISAMCLTIYDGDTVLNSDFIHKILRIKHKWSVVLCFAYFLIWVITSEQQTVTNTCNNKEKNL